MSTNEAICIIIVKTNTLAFVINLALLLLLLFFLIGARIKILIVSVFKINAWQLRSAYYIITHISG